MPTVTTDVETLFELIGQEFTDDKFEDLCFEFGIELEDVTSTCQLYGPCDQDRKLYRIDIPANRIDMLCVEGIARAIKTYLTNTAPPKYTISSQKHVMYVKNVAQRPYVVCAILRNVELNQLRYDGFIELQDKLHQNICRKRTLVAIGTHDLDTIKGPFTYECRIPTDINFVPLSQQKSMNAQELMEFYESDRKLSKFLHIIRDEPMYPVIYDSTGQVLSLPPIINSNHSKISLNTKNIFIECTATDLVKANIVLNTIVTMFSGYCEKPFTYFLI